jgi:hypothetical protein
MPVPREFHARPTQKRNMSTSHPIVPLPYTNQEHLPDKARLLNGPFHFRPIDCFFPAGSLQEPVWLVQPLTVNEPDESLQYLGSPLSLAHIIRASPPAPKYWLLLSISILIATEPISLSPALIPLSHGTPIK